MRGIPLLLKIGKRELDKSEVFYSWRFDKLNKKKEAKLALKDLSSSIHGIFDEIHAAMYSKAYEERQKHLKEVHNWEAFMSEIMQRNICKTPWCGVRACEAAINEKSK